MFILFPIVLILLTALVLFIFGVTRVRFKYPWMLTAGGVTIALVNIFLWRVRLPMNFSLPPWLPTTTFSYVPSWVVDENSWPYALSLVALAAAVIWTSVVRAENELLSWAGTLGLVALGILAVLAENPITLVLAWSAIDLFELVTMLRSAKDEEQSRGVVIAFATRLAGSGLVLWANLVSLAEKTSLDFRSTPASVGIFLLIAVGLRLGVLPLHLPYRKDNVLRRGFGTTLRLVSAAVSLALLARIPASAFDSRLTPYLLILTAVAALYAGWMWLRASDEIVGRPFWVLGMGSLAVASSLLGNPTGSIGWGVLLILCGGTLFLFSARQRKVLWLPWLGLWALSALPFSLTATAWIKGNDLSWLYIVPFIPAQAFLIAGFFRHTLHPGETSLESQEKWTKILYPLGLLIPIACVIYLGFSGRAGAGAIGLWWLGAIVFVLATGCTVLILKTPLRFSPADASNQWSKLFGLTWLYNWVFGIYNFLRKIIEVVTSSLEGEGGLLWSLLLLVLIISIFSSLG